MLFPWEFLMLCDYEELVDPDVAPNASILFAKKHLEIRAVFDLLFFPRPFGALTKSQKKYQGLQCITAVQVVTLWHPTVAKGFHLGLLLSNLNSAGGIRKPSASIWVARDTESWFTREKLDAAKEQMHHHRCVSPKGCLNKTCMLQRRVDAYASSHLKS